MRKRDNWEAITHKSLQSAVEGIRATFEKGAWALALDTERRCHKALMDANRLHPEPDIFREHYVGFSRKLWAFSRSAFGKVFEIASNNRVANGPIEWTRLQTAFMLEDKLRLSGEGCRIQDWIVYACDGYHLTDWPAFEEETMIREVIPNFVSPARELVRDSWLAPLWLRRYPYDPQTAWNREKEEQSRKFLSGHSYLLIGTLQQKLKKLADDIHFQQAVTPSWRSETTTRGRSTTLPDMRARNNRKRLRDCVMFIAIETGLEGLDYCRYLDRNAITPHPAWISEGCPKSYAAAYRERSAKWKQRIHNEKYQAKKRRAHLEETNPPELRLTLELGSKLDRPTVGTRTLRTRRL